MNEQEVQTLIKSLEDIKNLRVSLRSDIAELEQSIEELNRVEARLERLLPDEERLKRLFK